jgi:hypothetical protein
LSNVHKKGSLVLGEKMQHYIDVFRSAGVVVQVSSLFVLVYLMAWSVSFFFEMFKYKNPRFFWVKFFSVICSNIEIFCFVLAISAPHLGKVNITFAYFLFFLFFRYLPSRLYAVERSLWMTYMAGAFVAVSLLFKAFKL